MKLKALWVGLSVVIIGAVITMPIVMLTNNQNKANNEKGDGGLTPPWTDPSIIQTKEVKFNKDTNTILGWSDEVLKSGIKPSHLELPDEIDGYRVLRIAYQAFYDSKLESVKLPSGLVDTGDDSFSRNLLTEIDLPGSLTKIGESAFFYNLLTEINFPRSLVEIGEGAFAWNKFKEVIIPSYIKVIEEGAFHYNRELTKVVINNGVEIISKRIFEDCPIVDLDLGNTVREIKSGAFQNHNLNTLAILPSIEYIGSGAFGQTNDGISNPGITELNLSSTTELFIDDYAFAGNSIKEFAITKNLTLGARAFQSNPIEKIAFDNDVATELSESNGHFFYDQNKIGYSCFAYIVIPTDQKILKQNFKMPHAWFHGTSIWSTVFEKDFDFWFDVINCKTEDVCDWA